MGAFLREKPTAMLPPEAELEPNDGSRGIAPVPLPFFTPLSSILISPTGLLPRSRSRDALAAAGAARAAAAPDAAAPGAARAAAAPGAAAAAERV